VKVSIRIKSPSMWDRNYLIEAIKKRRIGAEFVDKSLPKGTEVLVTNYLSKDELSNLPRLKSIIIPTSGTENIPMSELISRRIKIYQDKSITSRGVVGYALDMLQKISGGRIDCLLKNKTIALLGFGNIGKGLYKRLSEYGPKFMIIRLNLEEKLPANVIFQGGLQDLDIVLKESDIVINALPLNSYTKNAGMNKRLKDGAIFVNLSRSGIFDEEKILKDVMNKKLNAAIMDIFPSSLDFKKYVNKKIILTPHIAGIYSDALKELVDYIVSKLRA